MHRWSFRIAYDPLQDCGWTADLDALHLRWTGQMLLEPVISK
jgi:hypothetical protein